MSEGHHDAGADEEHDMDFGVMTDDREVESNLPREDAVDRDPHGEDVRDLPGATTSGTSATNQEELYRSEPPNGARPKGPVQDGHFQLSRSPVVQGGSYRGYGRS